MLAVVGCQMLRPSVSLPAGAPLTPAGCGWDPATELAFAGWASLAEVGLEGRFQFADDAHHRDVFAIVSRDAIDQHRLGRGGTEHARGICLLSDDGTRSLSVVADDWTFAMPSSSG